MMHCVEKENDDFVNKLHNVRNGESVSGLQKNSVGLILFALRPKAGYTLSTRLFGRVLFIYL